MTLVNKAAPFFAGTAYTAKDKFEHINLHQFRGKWVLLIFYPKDFTFVCPTEVRKFNRLFKTFQALNVEVVCVSTDSEDTHRAWVKATKDKRGLDVDLKINLLSDVTHAISKAYDVLLSEEGVALRATFIIDPAGIVQVSHVHNNPVGRSTTETIRAIKAAQKHAATGDVVPVDWQEGEGTICLRNPDKYLSTAESKEARTSSKRAGEDQTSGKVKKTKAEVKAEKEAKARSQLQALRLARFEGQP